MTDNLRALTFEQWSTINRALCGSRLELHTSSRWTKQEHMDALNEAVDALNDFKEIS